MCIRSFILLFLTSMVMDANAALIHQFEFNGSLNDELGGPSLTLPAGGSLVDGEFVFKKNEGLNMNIRQLKEFTLDLVFRFDALIPNGGTYPIINGNRLNRPNFVLGFYDGELRHPSLTPGGRGVGIEPGVDTRVTITRDANWMFSIYQNGKLLSSDYDNYEFGILGGRTTFFGPPLFGAQGAIDFIHVYDHALTAAEIGSPSSDVPEPMPVALMGAGLAMIGLTRRRKSKLR